jgi:predicted DNA-binding transcriptional regulator AlpA
MTEPRLMSGADAAAYCGVTPATFSKWVADGRAPKPVPGTRRWDRKAIDLALDKASGIVVPTIARDDGEMALAEWVTQNEARKAAEAKEFIRRKEAGAAALTKRRERRPPRLV